LDICYQIEILKILKKIAKSCNLAIIMTIHDLNAAGFFCEKVICLNKGELAYYDKPSQVLTPEIIKKVFGVDAFYKNSLCFFS